MHYSTGLAVSPRRHPDTRRMYQVCHGNQKLQCSDLRGQCYGSDVKVTKPDGSEAIEPATYFDCGVVYFINGTNRRVIVKNGLRRVK
jgi:hypothetical protein